MNIIQWLQSKIQTNNKSVIVDTEDNIDENSNILIFGISPGHAPWVSVDFKNLDDKSCKNFADMLSHIGMGMYQKTVIDLLISLSKEQPNLAPAIETILINWGSNLTTKTNKKYDHKPFVRPRNAFSDSQNK